MEGEKLAGLPGIVQDWALNCRAITDGGSSWAQIQPLPCLRSQGQREQFSNLGVVGSGLGSRRAGSQSLPLPSAVASERQGSEELFSGKGNPVSLVWNWERLFKPLTQLREEVTDKY